MVCENQTDLALRPGIPTTSTPLVRRRLRILPNRAIPVASVENIESSQATAATTLAAIGADQVNQSERKTDEERKRDAAVPGHVMVFLTIAFKTEHSFAKFSTSRRSFVVCPGLGCDSTFNWKRQIVHFIHEIIDHLGAVGSSRRSSVFSRSLGHGENGAAFQEVGFLPETRFSGIRKFGRPSSR